MDFQYITFPRVLWWAQDGHYDYSNSLWVQYYNQFSSSIHYNISVFIGFLVFALTVLSVNCLYTEN